MAKRKSKPAPKDLERIQALIEEATVDCYEEEEAHTGLLTMIEENVILPFRARVIGEEVEVTDWDMPSGRPGLCAVCRHKGKDYRIDVTSLEWIEPLPKGFEWFEAYLVWLGRKN